MEQMRYKGKLNERIVLFDDTIKMSTEKNLYKFLFDELADARIKNWFLMSDAFGVVGILVVYLCAIYILLPKFMEKRRAFDLKNIITAYNIFQIIANTALVYGFVTSGWSSHYKWTCQPVEYTQSKMAMRMLSMTWWVMLIKVIDLLETVFFVLRKKQNQVTFLHVYHHISTVLMGWIVAKYFGGGFITLPIITNCFIHILMYTYYLVSSYGHNFKSLSKWKQTLTTCQIIQFVFIISYVLDASIRCNKSKFYSHCFVPYVFLNMVMFLNFYLQNYLKKNERQKTH